jgi:DNA polymerase-1
VFDWDAIEAKLAALFSGDEDDLAAFSAGYDIHTLTVCKVLRLPLPPDLVDPHKAESCAAWRKELDWAGKDDKRRVGLKAAKYSLAYGTDKMSILQVKDIDKQGLTRDELLDIADRYLKSKPKLVRFKRRTWEEVLRNREARTVLGRRRRLFPDERELATFLRTKRATATAREGLNHLFQGTVASLMNRALGAIDKRWPESVLGYQSHDGAKIAFPERVECWPEIRELVETNLTVNGYTIKLSATWSRVWSDGHKEEL